jgi:hypothetical protein
MKCDYCKKPATKINTTETRTGSGIVKTMAYACDTHAGMNFGDTCDFNRIRFQEVGGNMDWSGTWKRQ